MIRVFTHFVHRGPTGITESQREASEREAELNKIKLAVHLLHSGFTVWAWKNDQRVTVHCDANSVSLFCLQHQELVEQFKVWEAPYPSPLEATNLAYQVVLTEMKEDLNGRYGSKAARSFGITC